MDLTTLHEDALLQVLRYLDLKELLQCRGVCRRLREAALHPDLWRKRHLTLSWYQNDGVPLVCAALRLAPCLGRLSLESRSLEVLVPMQLSGRSLLASTSCAVSELDFELYSSDADCVASSIARQAALGRLNSVSLDLGGTIPDVRKLLDQLLHTQGLTSLNLWVDLTDPVDCQPAGDAVPSSLKRLQYGWPGGPVSSLLQWHAETLQVVHLQPPLPAGTAALLVALPNLRELKCPVLDDMPALLQCPALASLHLIVLGADPMNRREKNYLRGEYEYLCSAQQYLRGAQQFLRRAVDDRLETVTLEYPQQDCCKSRICEDALNLVRCLAGPDRVAPSSALRTLRLDYSQLGIDAWDPQPQLPALASVLHRLPRLVSLDLGGPPTTALLEAMDGTVLPRLQRLRVYCPSEAEQGCSHEWVHGQEPRALLMRYPRLHVEVEGECLDGHKYCEYCRANGCHVFEEDTVFTLFSHPERDGLCKQEHRGDDIRIVL